MFSKNKSVFYMYLIYFISMALFAVVRIISSAGYFSFLHSEIASIVFTIVIQVFIMLLIPIALHALINKKSGGIKNTLSTIRLKPVKSKVVIIAIVLGILAFFINIIVSTFFNEVLGFFGYNSPSSSVSETPLFSPVVTFLIDVVMVALLPAIAEETLHRGLLLNETNKIGYKKAILISSLLFALIHFNINQFSYAFVIGLLLGLITVATKTLWPAIIIHFVNNFISVYLSAARANGWFLKDFYEVLNSFLQSESMVITLLTALLFITTIVLCVIFLVLELFKETTIFNVNKALDNVFSEKDNNNNGTYIPTINDKQTILNEMLIKKSNLNLNVSKEMNPLELILPINKNVFKPTAYDNIFLTASLILGGLATFFTFVWGIL